MLCRPADLQEARRWQEDLSLSFDEVLSIVAESVSKKPDGLPKAFTCFHSAMERYAADKKQPKLQPAEGTANGSASSDGRPASNSKGSVQSAAVGGPVAGFSGGWRYITFAVKVDQTRQAIATLGVLESPDPIASGCVTLLVDYCVGDIPVAVR